MIDDGLMATLRAGVIAIGNLTKVMASVFPYVQSTATSATAGTNGAPPAQVAGYINSTLPNGTAIKIPYYLP